LIREINARNFKVPEINQTITGRDIFTGENGAGKSARLQAAQIAISNHIPKIGKLVSSTMGYAIGDRMEVELKTDDLTINRTFKRSYPKSGGAKCASTVELIPLGVKDKEGRIAEEFGYSSELIDMSMFLSMSANQRKEFIADICSKHIKQDDTKSVLSCINADVSLWNDDLPDIENLTNIEAFYKEQMSTLKFNIKNKRSHVNELKADQENLITEKPEDIQGKIEEISRKLEQYTSDIASSSSLLEARKALTSQLETIRSSMSEYQNLLNEHQNSDKDILKEKLNLSKTIEVKEEKIKTLAGKIKQIESEREDQVNKYHGANGELKVLENMKERFSTSFCPFIQKDCPEGDLLSNAIKNIDGSISDMNSRIKGLIERGKMLKSEIDASTTLLNEMQSEVDDAKKRLSDNEGELAWFKMERPAILDKLEKAEAEMKEVNTQITEMRTANTSITSTMIESARSEKKSLEELKDKALSQKNGAVEIEKTNLEIMDIEDNITKTEEIIKYIGKDGLKGDIIKSTHKPLVDAMNKLLEPTGFEADVQMERPDKADVFDICMKNGGNTIRFDVLSDGQKIIMSAAFISALQALSEAKIKMLLVEASELSDKSFMLLLSALDTVGSDIDNILIARLTFPPNTPNTWEIHELSLTTE